MKFVWKFKDFSLTLRLKLSSWPFIPKSPKHHRLQKQATSYKKEKKIQANLYQTKDKENKINNL
jgi:hypothetical protein